MITPGTLPEIPRRLWERLAIHAVTNRVWFWVAQSAEAYYKLAPRGSAGVERVHSEAAALARLTHPNVVTGEMLPDGDWEILQLRRVPGQSLKELRDQLSTQEKLRVLEQLQGTIAYINSQGLLHADVSAGNVIWDGERAHLIDFEEARPIRPPINAKDSPDVTGGPPCCWGDLGYGYPCYACLDTLRAWLVKPEFLELKQEVQQRGIWDPSSAGNTCEPWSTPGDGSVYQKVVFGDEAVPGQRDPEMRFRYLSASKKLSFHSRTVLDIGCNLGRLGAFLERLGVELYVGVDVDPGYVELAARIARLEGRDRSRFLRGDVCDGRTIEEILDISPRGYDVVICQSVYHHFMDKEAFWRNLPALRCRWFVFEGPVEPRYLLTPSWSEEKALLQGKGYHVVSEILDNDYAERLTALFERGANTTAGTDFQGEKAAIGQGVA